MAEEPYGRLGRRLRRILLMLPYAINHPGVSIDELSKKFGVGKADLIEDLNLVFLCGLPGYGPGDLIDVTMEDDRVYVRMADYFSAPLRLSPAEALSLYAGGAALASLPDMAEADALRGALAKLGRALGSEGGDLGIDVRLEEGAVEHLRAIQTALADEKALEIEYLSASKGELSTRTVDPWGLIAALGHWYLVGLDHLTGEERMFRTDRMRSAVQLDRDAPVPPDFDPQSYAGAFRGRPDVQDHLVVEISPSAMRWFEDYYPVVSKEPTEDGWQRVELLAGGESWAAALLVRLGAEARAVSPERFAIAAQDLAARIASRHR